MRWRVWIITLKTTGHRPKTSPSSATSNWPKASTSASAVVMLTRRTIEGTMSSSSSTATEVARATSTVLVGILGIELIVEISIGIGVNVVIAAHRRSVGETRGSSIVTVVIIVIIVRVLVVVGGGVVAIAIAVGSVPIQLCWVCLSSKLKP